jgi:hypothetical protein
MVEVSVASAVGPVADGLEQPQAARAAMTTATTAVRRDVSNMARLLRGRRGTAFRRRLAGAISGDRGDVARMDDAHARSFGGRVRT